MGSQLFRGCVSKFQANYQCVSPLSDENTPRNRWWCVTANGIPFGTTQDPIQLYRIFKKARRDPTDTIIQCDAGIALWRQDCEVRITTHSGEFLRPLLVSNDVPKYPIQSYYAKESLAACAEIFLGSMKNEQVPQGSSQTTSPDTQSADSIRDHSTMDFHSTLKDGSVLLCGSLHGTWNKLIQSGAIEYVTKAEECTLCTVSEFASSSTFPRKYIEQDHNISNSIVYTHCEIHPQASMFGLSASSIPFAHRNQSPRVLYGSAMSKQALGAPLKSPWLGTRGSELAQVHFPVTKTLVNHCLMKSQNVLGTYVQNVVIAILPFAGYNQEDSYVISRGAVERGLFMNVTYSIQRAHEGQLGSNRIEFGSAQTDSPDNVGSRPIDSYDRDGILRKGQVINGGDVLVHRYLKSRNLVPVPEATSGQRKYNSQSKVAPHHVRWRAGEIEKGRMDELIEWKTSNGGRTVRIRIAQVQEIGIGDKVSSRHGQKGYHIKNHPRRRYAIHRKWS